MRLAARVLVRASPPHAREVLGSLALHGDADGSMPLQVPGLRAVIVSCVFAVAGSICGHGDQGGGANPLSARRMRRKVGLNQLKLSEISSRRTNLNYPGRLGFDFVPVCALWAAPGSKVGRKVRKSRNIETRNGGPHSGLRLIRVEVLMTKSKNVCYYTAVCTVLPPAVKLTPF